MILGSGVLGGMPMGGSLSVSVVVVPPVTNWIEFDPINRRIILLVPTATTEAIYAAWLVWAAVPANSSYLPAFRLVGGDSIGDGVSIATYYFLLNDWKVRPMESTHTLTLIGNLVILGGGDQIVPTLGNFNVLVKLLMPAAAQSINTSGTLLTTTQIADAVWNVPVTSFTDRTKIGGYIAKVLLSVPRFLGLR